MKEPGAVGNRHYAGQCKLPLCSLICLLMRYVPFPCLPLYNYVYGRLCSVWPRYLLHMLFVITPSSFVKCTTIPNVQYAMLRCFCRGECAGRPPKGIDLCGCVGSPQFAAPRNSTNRLVSETICAHKPSNPKRPSDHALASCMGLHGGTRVTFMRMHGSGESAVGTSLRD